MWFWLTVCSTIGWAMANAVDSLLMRRYFHSPVVLMWFGSWIVLTGALLFGLFATVDLQWLGLMAFVSLIQYIADIYYFRVLRVIDVSLINASWAIISILMSLGGFVFFAETWSVLQTVGVVVVMSGIALLSFWHVHVSLKVFGVFFALAVPYAIALLLKKYAIDQGASVATVFTLTMCTHALIALTIPLAWPSVRTGVQQAWRGFQWSCLPIFCTGVGGWYLGSYLLYWAYEVGPVSLISITGNVQPFVAIALSYGLWKLAPAYAPREVLTVQTVQVKLISFVIVFGGLALLAI